MNRTHLLKLPKELKLGIVDHVRLQNDLESLRLTCRDIEPLAAARMYHDVRVDLARWSHIDPLYQPGHRARRYIRHLAFTIDPQNTQFRYNIPTLQSLCEGIKQLLLLLPPNRLEGIEMPTWLPMNKGRSFSLQAPHSGGMRIDGDDCTKIRENPRWL